MIFSGFKSQERLQTWISTRLKVIIRESVHCLINWIDWAHLTITGALGLLDNKRTGHPSQFFPLGPANEELIKNPPLELQIVELHLLLQNRKFTSRVASHLKDDVLSAIFLVLMELL